MSKHLIKKFYDTNSFKILKTILLNFNKNEIEDELQNILMILSKTNRLDLISLILKIDYKYDYIHALENALYKNKYHIFKFLLNYFKIFMKTPDYKFLLKKTVCGSTTRYTELLFNVYNWKKTNIYDVLEVAFHQKNNKNINYIIELIEKNIKKKIYTPKIISLAVLNNRMDIIKRIGFINCLNNEKYLHAVIKNKNLYLFEKVLQSGIDIFEYLHSCDSYIFYNLKFLKILLKHVENINQKDSYGWTLLHYTTYYNFIDSIKLVLSYNPDVNIKTVKPNTCDTFVLEWIGSERIGYRWRYGIANNHVPVYKKIVPPIMYNWTPLHFSVYNCNKDICKLLISKNADLTIKNNLNLDCIDIVKYKIENRVNYNIESEMNFIVRVKYKIILKLLLNSLEKKLTNHV